ncbi:gas vesicle protein, partial [Candidatus Wolfebacteria bacterium CG1_02_39_135]
ETELKTSTGGSTLKDVLELVLDKGIVIAGDIQIKLADVDLLTIKIRLLICGVDKAKEMGIDWWEHDAFLSSKAREMEADEEKAKLEARVKELEGKPKSKST